MAIDCARRGYNLFLTDIDESALGAISAGILRRYGVQVFSQACDLTAEGAIKTLLDDAQMRGIEFDMLLNVAGIDCEGGFTERSSKELKSMIGINIEATIALTHEVLARRDKLVCEGLKPFYIVFVSSLASLYPMPLKAAYAASKRFLYDFAYALGSEVEHKGVRVTTLCPGGLATNEESIAGIAAQGFWGNMTTGSVEIVARQSINKVLRGKRTYIPGILNNTLGAAGKLLPRALIAWAIRRRWQKARSSRIDIIENGGNMLCATIE